MEQETIDPNPRPLRHPLSLTRAPLLKIVPLFALGILCGDLLGMGPVSLLLVLSGLWLLGLFLSRSGLGRQSMWRSILLSVCLGGCLLLAGALRHRVQDHGRENVDALIRTEQKYLIEGRVTRAPVPRGDGVRLDLVDLHVQMPSGWTPVGGGVRAWVGDSKSTFSGGDRMRLTGKLRRPSTRRNPCGFDYQAYLEHRGIFGLVSVYDPRAVTCVGQTWRGWPERTVFTPLRTAWSMRLRRYLGGESLALGSGLLLGDREALSQHQTFTLRDAGVLHILTVSGLHVGLLVGTILLLGRVLRVPTAVLVVLALAACFLYAGVAGNRAPVVRASIMAAVVMVGFLIERDTSGVNTLCLAALVLLLLSPGELWGTGFQLSFAAVFGIVAFYPTLRETIGIFHNSGMRRVVDGLLVSLAAQLGVGPLVAYYFNQWTPVSLVANLLVLPLVGLAVPLAMSAVAAAAVSGACASVLFAALWAVLKVLGLTASLLATIPGGSFVVKRPAVWMIVGAYAGMITLFVFLSRRRWTPVIVCAAGFAVILLLYLDPLRPERLEVTVLDVGLGSAAFVRFPSGEVGLIDGGDCSPYRDYGNQVVVPYVRSQGHGRLDLILLSHPHKDHFGGLRAVVEELSAGALLGPGRAVASEEYLNFLKCASRRSVPFEIVTDRREIERTPDVHIEILPMDPDSRCRSIGSEHERVNNESLVVRLEYGDVSILFTGDIEACREIDLLRHADDLDCDVVIVPHHGSPSSSTQAFVDALTAKIAVISVGQGRWRNLPSEDVIHRYRSAGARVFRTDKNGAVTITTDGKDIWTECVIKSDSAEF